MNARPIEASATIAVSLLVHVTRERRDAEHNRFTATTTEAQRFYSSQWVQLGERANHVTIKALRAGVDVELLCWLVQAATDRQLESLVCETDNSNDHLVKVIQQMRTPKAQAPKAKAPKAFKGKAGTDYQAAADTLRSATSREDAAWMLASYTMAEMRHIWTLAGRTDRIPSALRRMDLIAFIVNMLVGYQLDHQAILRGAMR